MRKVNTAFREKNASFQYSLSCKILSCENHYRTSHEIMSHFFVWFPVVVHPLNFLGEATVKNQFNSLNSFHFHRCFFLSPPVFQNVLVSLVILLKLFAAVETLGGVNKVALGPERN